MKPRRHAAPSATSIGVVVGAWTAIGFVLAAQAWLSYSMRGEPIAWTRSLAVWLTWAWIWAAQTPIVLALVEAFPITRPLRSERVLLHVAAGAAMASLNLAAFAAFAPWVGALHLESTWSATFARLMGATFLLDLPVYGLILGVAHGLRLARATRERERRTLRLEAQLADARLETLRSQLRPHFLFNALNTVAVLMREDVDRAERVLLRLSDLLRATLVRDGSNEVSLREEIAMLEAYLAIEGARFEDRLTYRFDVAAETLAARVPRLILQPLVENAVEHGIAPRRSRGNVEVSATRSGEHLTLVVADDGVGLDADAAEGIGWSNTRSRLALLYGERQAFSTRAAAGGGLVVTIDLPFREFAVE